MIPRGRRAATYGVAPLTMRRLNMRKAAHVSSLSVAACLLAFSNVSRAGICDFNPDAPICHHHGAGTPPPRPPGDYVGRFSARCSGDGIRTFSGTLEVAGDVGWAAACNATPLTLDGESFAHATRCIKPHGEFDVHDHKCLTNRPIRTCVPPSNPFLPSPSGGPTHDDALAADMALFVVGPNHTDVPTIDKGEQELLHPDAGSVENIAMRVFAAWHGDPHKLIVAVSETGGCDDCGSPATIIPGGAAHTIANKLQALYHSEFQVRRAIPSLPSDSANMPAIITGGFWSPPKGVNFIGKDFASRASLVNPGTSYRYGRVILTSPLGAVGFSVVHLALGSEANGRLQLQDLVHEIKDASSNTDANFIIGDFNHFVGGSDDSGWQNIFERVGGTWTTGGAPCTTPQGQIQMYHDIMNIVEFPAPLPKHWVLRPIGYFYDAASDGSIVNPSATMDVLGIAHPILGVTLKVDHAAVGSPVPAHTFSPSKAHTKIEK